MAHITVLGGTGYTGSNLVRRAATAGHQVVSYSRSAPDDPVAEVEYRRGSVIDSQVLATAAPGADVIIGALAPRGELEEGLQAVYQALAESAAHAGSRFVVVGGFSALRPAVGAPRFIESGDVPAEFAKEVQVMGDVLDWLTISAPGSLDWLYVSPAADYGSYVPGEELSRYRTSDEIALFDADGRSAISGADFASAVIAEIETPTRHRAHFSVAY